ncbi:TPA: methyltransferase domain-containing protein [Campylobacter jejuni]|uniref:Methyltransferase domain-containing protein n=2 Tax=Campylobacter jejuni TaxID=197 RepID=A0A5Z1DAF6_CAMJU|nr:class I SAM-dependent methyltransferase [Campylobacter jejuni]EAH5242442.1 methyltransferase domain-containing protein [Campylobacter jejuni]EAI2678079.1 methyltransferase domain-containing protein [Campylobacter jejuni]EAI2802235.1 methyltransferase domain-containing protein [Campylobacter jejuni]EAL0475994.1 methyltransferase domain-containing protein [Campylobacter jejuni]EAL0648750.1 methyltransferase domain-containing protein [Campylobacter jejuni]
MHCPLCQSENNQKELFKTVNAFTSSGKLNKNPTQIKTTITTNDGGGGYCKGNNAITFTQCQDCGYIYNSTFDLNKISKEYQSEGYFSRKIVSKAMSNNIKTIKDKCLKYINKNSTCLEVAPGSGDMVNALIRNVKFMYTVDPSLVSLEMENINNLKHIHGFFNYNILKDKLEYKIDFIMFRHLLEHINTPLGFLKDVVKLLENNGIIYIEVPNIEEIIEHKRFYDIFNDHCGYYQKNVLINTLKSLGCEFIDEIYLFRGQHMGLFFRKNTNIHDINKLDFKLFDKNIYTSFQENIRKLNNLLHDYNNIAIYGSGAHGNTIITFIDNPEKIKKCFDLDIRKQGMYLQNSSIIIQEPNVKNFKDLEVIIIAASLYEEEIIKSLREKGYKGDIIATEKETIVIQ